MKKFIMAAFLFVLTTLTSYSQTNKPADYKFTNETFNTDIFNYKPVKRDGVTDQKFNYALHILDDTRQVTKGDPQKLNAADLWNITTAFVILKEPKTNVAIAFKKAITMDASTICSYIKAMGPSGLDKIIPETFLPFYIECAQNTVNTADLDVKKYALDNKLNIELVSLINDIRLNDQKFRMTKPVDWEKQRPLDIRNQRLIDSLYKIHNAYIGKSSVGKELESVMWAVIQHSDIETMERYLTCVQKAIREKELDVVPLKMLIDRIYTIKYGYQVFGSQAGVTLADEPIRNEIIQKYSLN